MKKLFILLIISILQIQNSWAGEPFFPVSAIDPALKEKAHAVMRLKENIYQVKSLTSAVEKTHIVVTILDEHGQQYATDVVRYDKFTKINNIEGTIYDARGERVKRIKKDDILDMSAVSGGSLYEDNRVKIIEAKYAQYPFTVEFSYETTITNNTFFLPRWFPQSDEELAIENESFKIIAPEYFEIKYKEINGLAKAAVYTLEGNKLYQWNVKNLKTREEEPYSSKYVRYGPGVFTSMNDFQLENFKGSMRSWEDLGKFTYRLNEGRDQLPDNIKEEVRKLVANETDPVAKVKKVYEYLQSKTRYISVQLGIGGWQTFDAKSVAEKSYGDCKALSNYTMAMLKVAGIESYTALVGAGENQPDVLIDFPNSYFNHMITCVPMAKDTIWLECTSQNNPFGYMGDFTGDRHALLVTPKGGKLVKTPRYQAKDNLQIRKINVDLDTEGNAKAVTKTVLTGIQQDDYANVISELNAEDQKKFLYKSINIPSFEIDNYQLSLDKKRIPAVTANINLTVRKCAAKSGTRLFLSPNLMSQLSSVPPTPTTPRVAEVALISTYTDTDTVVYNLPKAAVIEVLPEAQNIESKFGTYQSKTEFKDGKLLYIRRMTRNRGTFPASAYQELIDFYRKIVKADKMQAVLKL
jgi:hypothetical protein